MFRKSYREIYDSRWNVVCTQNVHMGSQTNSTASEMGVRKRRSRRPSTSVLSDKVWREMRKQITGRAQDDGVT